MIPPRYKNVQYSDVPSEIQKALKDIKQRGIYLHGGVGTGKTHIAYSILKHALEKNIPVMFKNSTELFRELRIDFGREHKDRRYLEDELMDFQGILFIDDIGAEKLSEWVAETFYLIINKRYNQVLPTIFTSNLPINELAERLGDRIVSRIVETCSSFEIKGNDRRLSK